MADDLDRLLDEITEALRTVVAPGDLAEQLRRLWERSAADLTTDRMAERVRDGGHAVSDTTVWNWHTGGSSPRSWEPYEELLKRLLKMAGAEQQAADAVLGSFGDAVKRIRKADADRKRSNPGFKRAGGAVSSVRGRNNVPEPDPRAPTGGKAHPEAQSAVPRDAARSPESSAGPAQSPNEGLSREHGIAPPPDAGPAQPAVGPHPASEAVPGPAPGDGGPVREEPSNDGRLSSATPPWFRSPWVRVVTAVAVIAPAVLLGALWMSSQDRPSTPGSTGGAQKAKAPAGPVTPHPSATSVRVEWKYQDGSHRAVIDNAPPDAGAAEESWIRVDDRQADRHWAGVVFILYGEPMTENPKKWRHRHEDTNGANNGELVQDGRTGVFPGEDVYAARICEGVGSDLDPESCNEWRYFERS
ncbi:hypothetical protein OIE71_32465 [Streptomyces sp. NBC_01725]|uniref:hypothetical protein n=1 Tax=Streptomyces sp. NBC_01725 TaxID=2975923 RepID=UPI002E2ABA97|nr:hypothetical protein [Streptomyces sp. NBC_01725]